MTPTTSKVAQPKSIPAKINQDITYFDHQIEGIRVLARLSSFLLADEMGLGKTIQSMTVAALDFDAGWAKRVLVLTPAPIKFNWDQDLELHTLFDVVVLDGPPEKRAKMLDDFDADVLIVNYDLLHKHLDQFNDMNFDIVICDEAHALKNPKAVRTKAVHKLQAKRFFMLTGSPVLNRADELWSILHRIDPSAFPSYWKFINRYCNTPDAPVWMADGTFRPMGKVQPGDEVMGWRSEPVGAGGTNRRALVSSVVEEVRTRTAPMILRCTLEDGSVIRCTPDHQWLSANCTSSGDQFVKVRHGSRLGSLSKIVDVPEPVSMMLPEKRDLAMWLIGMYDGEGSAMKIAQSPTHNPEICEQLRTALDLLEIPYRQDDDGFAMKGGVDTRAKLLEWGDGVMVKADKVLEQTRFDLPRLNNASPLGFMLRKRNRVVDVVEEGPGEVVSMQTSTGNYVAWGHASKNCLFGGFNKRQIVGVKKPEELKKIVDTVMLRRLKKDCLDLPDKQYITVYVELNKRQREIYDKLKKEMLLELPHDPDPMQLESGMQVFGRLSQVTSTPANVGLEDDSAKLDAAVLHIQTLYAANEKCIVFFKNRASLECCRVRLEAVGIQMPQLHGDISKKRRQETINEWSASKEPLPFGMMLQVGGVGLNLTAARHVLFVDRLFVPKLNEQAEDRAHRIGASIEHPVQVTTFIARKTIDQRVERILAEKDELFDSLVNPNDWKKELYRALMSGDDDV